MLLEGLYLPLTTPFSADGRLNLKKLEQNVERYSLAPGAGLVALYGTGEPSMLSDEEARQVLRGAAGTAAAEKVLVAGVSRDSVAGTLDVAEYAAGLGYDAVLVKQPGVLRGRSPKEALQYFQMVADRSALPVVLLSELEGMLSPELVAELAAHPGVIGMVDAGADRQRVERLRSLTAAVRREVTVTAVFAAVTGRMLGRQAGGEWVPAESLTGGSGVAVVPKKMTARTRTKTVGFQILTGGVGGVLEGLRGGAVGAVAAFAACAPQACYEVLAAWKDGDEGLAEEKQRRLGGIARRIEAQLGVPGIKYGCDLNGYYGGPARLPLLPLTGAERNEVEELMLGIRN